MTNKERKLVLHCLKANSDFHKEVCEECSRYPECDHFVQDGVMEKLIEELEREPCEDAISREVLLNRLANIAKANAKSDAQKALMGRVIFFTEHLPPVQPKIKTGHWIDHSEESYVECPLCGHATNCEDNIDELHYCFHCGARMINPRGSEGRTNK